MSWVRVFQEEQRVTINPQGQNELDSFQKWKEDICGWGNNTEL